ncbi:protein of unknown function [Georgenia satyanarayanai]|uniref:DUF222 domain-containing protein n=1 Tax=Georgenia satyanarayanai TaxID=860221 RepID=A0A2Y8ZXJ7_9MICO|nr:HNH endonuclease signature motif containing protein [Georgenia satyanarayanai]PYG02206.1 uncharacterized protein DUF222 [Georgenia satyanarayanai]SSA37041.1 protein of unknown function [Georgenia satyanarayanai]
MTLSEREDIDPDGDAPLGSESGALAEARVAELLSELAADSPLHSSDLVAPTVLEPPAHADFATFRLSKYAETEPTDWARQAVGELAPVPRALGDYLEHLPPGPRLAQVLDVVETVEDVDEYSLVEVVAAYRRMESWAAARTARAAAALSRRPALNPTWPGKVAGRDRGECVVGEELSMRLRMSRQSAMRIVETGRGFEGLFHLTAEALEEGQIDYPRAQAIVRALEDLPTDVAMAAQWEVLEKAPGRTLRQVQSDLSRAVIAVDPDHADERHRRARQRRCVYRPQPLPDGMARVVATVPAADAVAFDLALDSAARAAKHQGDKRTHDQLRADAFALMAHTALACGHIGPDAALRVCSCGVIAEPADGGSAFDAEDTALPPGVSPPEVADASPPPPTTPPGETGEPPPSGPAAPEAPVVVDPPGAPSPEPGTACSSDPPPPERGLRRRPTTSTSSPPYPGHRLPGGLLPTVRLGSLGGRKVDVRITVPLGDFLPAPGEQSPLERIVEPVAELEGYGPVPPVIARALAAGGVWRRLVTDHGTEQVIDVGRTRYQPPAAMADLVRERDRTCTRPGCSCAARHAEIDHEHEWQHGGATSVENTGPNCGRDHRVKTIGAYTVAHGSDRTYAWAGPTGHGYLRRPDGTIVTMPRHTAEGLRALGRRSVREREAIDPAFVDGVLAEIAAGTDVGGSWVPAGGLRSTLLWPGVDDGPSWAADDEPPF